MEPTPSWESCSCAATQEFPYILRNPKVHYRVHKSTPLVSVHNQINPVPTTPSYLRSILILSTHISLGLPSVLFPFQPISYMHSASPHSWYMPCQSHPLWLDHSNYIWRRAPHYAGFSNLLSLHPSSVQIFSPAPCFQTPQPMFLP
jgi:hypothetical protein